MRLVGGMVLMVASTQDDVMLQESYSQMEGAKLNEQMSRVPPLDLRLLVFDVK